MVCYRKLVSTSLQLFLAPFVDRYERGLTMFGLIEGFFGLVIGLIEGVFGLVTGLIGGAFGLVFGLLGAVLAILVVVGLFLALPIVLLIAIF